MSAGEDSAARFDRLHSPSLDDDQRTSFQRDRDRILYSSAFRRLEGVTQVASVSEGYIFHNRLTHSLKVSQIARRLAEHLLDKGADKELLSPDVAEAAALAHDLGHPPFGHVGETELHNLLDSQGHSEGFEGNPQSFRVMTRLAVRFKEWDGLNLTRATLAAVMKYPWLREPESASKSKKWAAYRSDKEAYEFARAGLKPGQKTLEAQVMDHADDIAYSVHDLEDFHRANKIPWLSVRENAELLQDLISKAEARWYGRPTDSDKRLQDAWSRLLGTLGLVSEEWWGPFVGNRGQRQDLRFWTSSLVKRFVLGAEIKNAQLTVPSELLDEIRFLKALTWYFVIDSAALAAQQHGQRRILRELFEDLLAAATDPEKRLLFPHRTRHLLENAEVQSSRAVADTISGMTEEEVVALHKRLRGLDGGTMMNPIIR